jgi:hypothetical protein
MGMQHMRIGSWRPNDSIDVIGQPAVHHFGPSTTRPFKYGSRLGKLESNGGKQKVTAKSFWWPTFHRDIPEVLRPVQLNLAIRCCWFYSSCCMCPKVLCSDQWAHSQQVVVQSNLHMEYPDFPLLIDDYPSTGMHLHKVAPSYIVSL